MFNVSSLIFKYLSRLTDKIKFSSDFVGNLEDYFCFQSF